MANPFEIQVLNPFQALLYGQQSYDSGVKRSQENAKRSALQALMSGGGASDPNAVANTLLASGDTSGAATYAQLAGTLEQRKQAQLNADRTFNASREDATRSQSNADRSYGLQARAAARAGEDKFSIQEIVDPNTGAKTLVRVPLKGAPGVIDTGTPTPSEPNNPFTVGGKFNEGEGKAAGFADRMLQSEAVLRSTNGKPDSTAWIHDQGADFNQTQLSAARGAPMGIGRIANYGISEDRQKYNQAQEDFIIAQLRRESGAAISPDEFTKAQRQYFPAPGDSQDVINQKAATRRAAVEAMGREAGRSYRPKSIYTADGRVVPLPKVGEMKDGYRFKGGDPSNQNSWVKAQ